MEQGRKCIWRPTPGELIALLTAVLALLTLLATGIGLLIQAFSLVADRLTPGELIALLTAVLALFATGIGLLLLAFALVADHLRGPWVGGAADSN